MQIHARHKVNVVWVAATLLRKLMKRRQVVVFAAVVAVLAVAGPAWTAYVPQDRMTGGGSSTTSSPNQQVNVGLDLPCTLVPGDELQISWFNPQSDPPGRVSFHMKEMTDASCTVGDPDDPNDGGSHTGDGTGLCHTGDGPPAVAMAHWTFTDADNARDPTEFRRSDTLEVQVRSENAECVLPELQSEIRGNFRMVGNDHL